jgi:uncharacterized tellurite resistance protein B-like protein
MTDEDARGILLAAIMEADRKIQRGEVDFGTRALGHEVWSRAMLEAHHVQEALAHWRHAPLPDRRAVIDELWTMTRADGGVHAAEFSLISEFETALGLDGQAS